MSKTTADYSDESTGDYDEQSGSILPWVIGGAVAVTVVVSIIICAVVCCGGNGSSNKDTEVGKRIVLGGG